MRFSTLSAAALATASFALAIPTAAAPPTGGANATAASPPPVYAPASDFDFQSLNLALNQEWIELDLFNYGLTRFTTEQWAEYGIDDQQISLIRWMAEQEIGHATLLTNILQNAGAKQCQYRYNFETVPEFLQFCAVLTRWGESGVYGFLPHLDSRPAAQLLLQSIATEARQQMAFRQLAGAQAMPVWFETGISQSYSWTLLSPYLISCPAENPRIEWNIFPTLTILNNPNLSLADSKSAISTNRTAFVQVNQTLQLQYDAPGKNVSYNQSYSTAVGTNVTSEIPTFCAFISQLNATNTPFTSTGNGTGTCQIPGGFVFGDDPIVNGTMFVSLLSSDVYVTPFNSSLLDAVTVSGPAVLIAG